MTFKSQGRLYHRDMAEHGCRGRRQAGLPAWLVDWQYFEIRIWGGLTIGTWRSMGEGAGARQVCQLVLQHLGHVVVEAAVVSIVAAALCKIDAQFTSVPPLALLLQN